MGRRRPPDILRKSHAHTEGKQRARGKQALREALDVTDAPVSAHRGLLISLDGVVYLGKNVIAGAAETIQWLTDKAIPHLFVTNMTSGPAEALVERLAGFGIVVEVGEIQARPDLAASWPAANDAEPVALTGPAGAFFEAALERLGLAPADCWMIGDDIGADVAGAQAAGLKAILVRTGKFRPGDLRLGIEPELVIESIADLPRAWPAIVSS